jgi:hypothetical protein
VINLARKIWTYAVVGIIVLVIVGFVTGIIKLPEGGQLGGQEVALRVQTNDAITEAVFSPAGASVKVWNKATGVFLGALAEDGSHDGKWDSAFYVPVGTWVTVKVEDSGSTFHTRVVDRQVMPGASGVDRISVLLPIDVYPRSATDSSDLAGAMFVSGSEITNATGIASGTSDIVVMLTASSSKTYGGQAYTDPENPEDYYIGGFMVFALTTTTARATLTGADYHFAIGSTEYWIYCFGQITNDDDDDTDGTITFHITFNNIAAAADALDVDCYDNAKLENVLAGSFGTSDTSGGVGELWIDIHLS